MRPCKVGLAVGMAAVMSLGGCGAVYVSSDVKTAGGVDQVQVVQMTSKTVQVANRSSYEPRALPAAFSQVVRPLGQPRTAPNLPEPVFDAENRPSFLDLRLPPAVNPGSYRIGVSDVLILATPSGQSSVEELAGLVAAQNQRQGYTVQDDGSISVPDVGRINVGGMTLEGAEDAIFERLVSAGIDPSFSVEVAEFNSQQVAVGGAVAQPGVVPITLTPLYLDEVVAAVGGVTVADDEFGVVRLYRDGQLYQIPINDLYSDEGIREVRLVAGDSVFVDTEYDLAMAQSYFEEQIARAEFTQQARSDALTELQTAIALRRSALEEERQNFRDKVELGAIDRDYAYVAGEVRDAGRFPLPFENRAYLADALFEAGGVVSTTGNPGQIYLLRGQSDATSVIAYRLDGRNATNFVLASQMELRPGDVVFVAAQPVTRWNRALSQMLPTINLGQNLSRSN